MQSESAETRRRDDSCFLLLSLVVSQEKPMSQSERVTVGAPPVERNDPKDATCFAIMYPLHGESFTRYFPDLSTFRRLRDHHFTGTYRAIEVATLDQGQQQWVVSPPDVFYGGSLFTGERRFAPPSSGGKESRQ